MNKVLKRNYYPLPVINDLLAELSNAKVFSVVDAKNDFSAWHVQLNPESSFLTNFGTLCSRSCWTPAAEKFQRHLDNVLELLSLTPSVPQWRTGYVMSLIPYMPSWRTQYVKILKAEVKSSAHQMWICLPCAILVVRRCEASFAILEKMSTRRQKFEPQEILERIWNDSGDEKDLDSEETSKSEVELPELASEDKSDESVDSFSLNKWDNVQDSEQNSGDEASDGRDGGNRVNRVSKSQQEDNRTTLTNLHIVK